MARGGYRGSAFKTYPYHSRLKSSFSHEKSEPCMIYTRTGRCDHRKTCRYQHQPQRVALCQQYLKTGRCSKSGGERCFLSHEPRAENTPMCKHYARGHCTNSECKFAHMDNLGTNGQDNTEAPVCRSFALNGWCDRGTKCTRRHTFDCPDFDAHGSCANPACKLEHVIKGPAGSHQKRDDRNQIKIDDFLRYLQTASRESFDSETKHTAPVRQPREVSEHSESGESDDEESEDSDSSSEWENGREPEALDVNADFIEV